MAGLDMTMKVKSAEYRPCEVSGRKALFHRWVESDKVIFEITNGLTVNEVRHAPNLFNNHNIIHPPGSDVKTIKSFYGLVEYEDGTMEKVDPEKIKFKDSRETFMENGGDY